MDITTSPLRAPGPGSGPAEGAEGGQGPAPAAPVTTDGRSLRRERNRDAVIKALLELIREGSFEPGTSEIAERAGVSHRSVFRYFDDLDDLVRAAIDHEIAQVVPLAVISDIGEGPLEERIAAAIETVLRIYDYTREVGRVARARALGIPSIDEALVSITRMYRVQLAANFAPELEALDPTRADDLLDAIQIVLSFESYDFASRRLDRGDDDIRRAWGSALAGLLAT